MAVVTTTHKPNVINNFYQIFLFLKNYVIVDMATSPCYCYQMQLEMQCIVAVYNNIFKYIDVMLEINAG